WRRRCQAPRDADRALTEAARPLDDRMLRAVEAVRRARRRFEPTVSPETTWFRDHFEVAPREIATFVRGGAVDIEGRRVADVGCGDGIMALGVALRLKPAELVGFDVNPTDVEDLLRRAHAQGAAAE